MNRGMRLTPELQAQLPDRHQLCVGVGRVTAGRRELFRQQQGVAVEMVQRVFDVVPCNGELLLGWHYPCLAGEGGGVGGAREGVLTQTAS